MRRLFTKKGISPLIATVLLIAFAVALGAVVMNWGRGFVEETQTYSKSQSNAQYICSTDVGFEINSIVHNCTANATNITLESTKVKDIVSFTIKFQGDKGSGTIQLNNTADSLTGFEIQKYGINGTAAYGNLTNVKIIPRIQPDPVKSPTMYTYCDDRYQEYVQSQITNNC